MLLVEKARLSHWISHTKGRVVAAMEMHAMLGTAVATGKVAMLQKWVDKLDALAAEVQQRLGCIPGVGAEQAAKSDDGGAGSGSESESGAESGHESELPNLNLNLNCSIPRLR